MKNGILKAIKTTLNANEEIANLISRIRLRLSAFPVLSILLLDFISSDIVMQDVTIIIANGITQVSDN